jgi:drug/metabolite transporter (DMT)-like permease
VILALGSALFGTFAYGAASVLQAIGAGKATGPAVVRQPAYLVGLVCDGVAWLASLVALQRMPAFAVQSLLAGSVGVTVLLAWLLLGVRPRARDGFAIVLLVASLVGVAAASGSQAASAAPDWFGVASVAVAIAIGALLAVTYRRGQWAVLSVIAGASFAGAAVCARGVTVPAGWWHLLSEPLAWAIVAFGVLGAFGYARALESGQVGPTTAVLWVVEVLLAGVVGVAVLGDQVRAGLQWLAVASVVVAVGSSGVLALSPSGALPVSGPNHDV